MAQLTSLDRKNKGQNIIDRKINIQFKAAIHPFLLKLSKLKLGYKLQKECKYSGKISEFSKTRPIIFVCNHATAFDIPIALNSINEHTYLLLGKQPLEKIDEIFFKLNGTIFVDRKDKKDTKISKEAMIELLNKNKNILVFPEGTWNMTDSNLMLEMKWGIIEIAQSSDALIVPLALDYDLDNKICKYKFGSPIDVKNYSLKEGIRIVRDQMATLRWELFETKSICERKNINVEEERTKIMNLLDDYPKLDYKYEQSVIFRTSTQPDEVFEPLKRL